MSREITVSRAMDEVTYGGLVEVVNMVCKKGATTYARMTFVVREGNNCSVSGSHGSIVGMAEITKKFFEEQKPVTLVNQVLSESEVKAMYQAGLRLNNRPLKLNMKQTVDELLKSRSRGVMMSL